MEITTLTKANFDAEALQSEKTVLIDFWAPWCGPCRMLSPTIDEIAAERDDVKVCKINVDDEPELAQRFSVMSIPMLVVIKNGEVADTAVGMRPKDSILKLL